MPILAMSYSPRCHWMPRRVDGSKIEKPWTTRKDALKMPRVFFPVFSWIHLDTVVYIRIFWNWNTKLIITSPFIQGLDRNSVIHSDHSRPKKKNKKNLHTARSWMVLHARFSQTPRRAAQQSERSNMKHGKESHPPSKIGVEIPGRWTIWRFLHSEITRGTKTYS